MTMTVVRIKYKKILIAALDTDAVIRMKEPELKK
jgi:hypothetical protein